MLTDRRRHPVSGKTTESDRHPNPNPGPFCMEWKQIGVLLVAVRYGSLLLFQKRSGRVYRRLYQNIVDF